jgi:hypothetical protein
MSGFAFGLTPTFYDDWFVKQVVRWFLAADLIAGLGSSLSGHPPWAQIVPPPSIRWLLANRFLHARCA